MRATFSRAIVTLLCIASISLARPSHDQTVAASSEADTSLPGRRALLARRDAALTHYDQTVADAINASLAADAISRAVRIHDAWMFRRNPTTKLFPQSDANPEWNYRNTAADFFGFQLSIAIDQHLPSVPLLRETLAAERALNPAGETGGLCRAISSAGELLSQPSRERMFSTCEYLKDGLTPLYERTGDPAVLARMRELADAIIAASSVQSRFGKVPSRDSEINGDVLQSFGRLGFACGEANIAAQAGSRGARYHAMLATITDAIVGQMLAHHDAPGAPLHFYDYQTDRFPSGVVRLRDHGNETAVGLAEAFATAVALKKDPEWSARADRWAEPLARMYELLLSRGVNAEGLLVTQLEGGGGKGEAPKHELTITDSEPCDNWGYLLSGVLLFVEAEQRHGKLPAARLDALLARSDAIALTVTRTDNLRWEGDNPDGMADSIESAIHIAAHRPVLRDRLLTWTDTQIVYLFQSQHPDGFCTGNYLDGNVIRTAMMYADARRAQPSATPPNHMRLPWNWPRINAWPDSASPGFIRDETAHSPASGGSSPIK